MKDWGSRTERITGEFGKVEAAYAEVGGGDRKVTGLQNLFYKNAFVERFYVVLCLLGQAGRLLVSMMVDTGLAMVTGESGSRLV